MAYTLENALLQFSLDVGTARWSVASRAGFPAGKGAQVDHAQVGVTYRRGRGLFQALDSWRSGQVDGPRQVASPHGPLRQLTVHSGRPQDPLSFTLIFALPEAEPFMLWQLAVENRGRQPVYLEQLELLSAGFIYKNRFGPRGLLRLAPQPRLRAAAARPATSSDQRPSGGRGPARNRSPEKPPEPAFFGNGWQSWSYAGVYGAEDHFRRTRLGPVRVPVDVNAGTPQPGRAGLFASDMFGVLGDRAHRSALLVGFLSQRQHFGSLEAWIAGPQPALRLWANGDGARLEPGQQVATDWAYLQFLHLAESDPFGPYCQAVARAHDLPPALGAQPIPTGWCSWYQFSSDDYRGALSAGDVRANLEALACLRKDLPLELVQIDDGYQAEVGDWLAFNPGFPEGVAPLAGEIRAAGFRPGLWLAPFIVHPRARLAAEHPDWLLRGRFNRPVNAGYLWGTFTTALDLTHPAALEYTAEVVDTAVHAWGFPYLKLDFLYAGALPGRRSDPSQTRAQALRTGLAVIRQAAGQETTLLGCGCPLGAAIGLVDALRIGADTARRWRPYFKGFTRLIQDEPGFPSVRNATHNALTRAFLHRRWWLNDPDCLLLRPTTDLTLPEVQTAATVIALTGGSLLFSDDIPALPAERLRLAQALLPPIGKRPYVLDWFDHPTPQRLQLDLDGPAGAWQLLALCNWADRPADLALRLTDFYLDPTSEYLARSFWSGQLYRLQAGQLLLPAVPAHGVVLLALRPRRLHRPQYLGSDLHLSQGQEVTGWEAAPAGLRLRLARPGRACGNLDLALPRSPASARLDGRALAWQPSGEDFYRFGVEFEAQAILELAW
jgi:alpha-galactosidase